MTSFVTLAAAYVAPLPPHARSAVRMQQGLDWLNPLYWRDAYVSAGHVLRNVEPGARVLELGKDAKNLYYIKDPAEVAFVAPSLQGGEGPIREAAAKLSIPKFSVQIGPLDGMQLRAGGYDAVSFRGRSRDQKLKRPLPFSAEDGSGRRRGASLSGQNPERVGRPRRCNINGT